MENKMMMPASYNVLSNEEMTYTEGGATVGQALAAWFWPGYATQIGIGKCREEVAKDRNNWLSNGNVTNGFYYAGIIVNNALFTIGSLGLYAVAALGNIYF